MKKQKNITLGSAIASVGSSARRKAFRRQLPVAISEDGKAVLLYADGTRRPITQQTIRELQHAKA